MTLSKNLLIAFSFAIFFVISNVHCIDIIPDIGVKLKNICYNNGICDGPETACGRFCIDKNAISGVCDSGKCCCLYNNKIKL
ncbi:hypothetical protein Bca4012_012776 [Brassica carinata]